MKAGSGLPFDVRFGFSRSTSVRASWARDLAFDFFLLRSFPRKRESISCFFFALASPLLPGRAEAAFFAFADAFSVFTLSPTLRLDCHTASLAFAIPSIVRRLITERGFS